MEKLSRFIKIGDDRINIDEIVSYGLGTDWNDDDEEYNFLFVQIRTSDDLFQYDEPDVEFDIYEKIEELDDLFLIK